MAKEGKTWSFTRDRGIATDGTRLTTTYFKPEDQLTEDEKKLLLGEFISHWEELPAEVQLQFMKRVIDSAEQEQAEILFDSSMKRYNDLLSKLSE